MLFTLRPSNLRSVSHNIVQTYPYSMNSDGHLFTHTSFKHPITNEFQSVIQLSHSPPPLSGSFSMTIENSIQNTGGGIQVVKPETHKEYQV